MGRSQLDWCLCFNRFPLIDAFAPLPAAAQETTIYKDSIRRFNELPEGKMTQQKRLFSQMAPVYR